MSRPAVRVSAAGALVVLLLGSLPSARAAASTQEGPRHRAAAPTCLGERATVVGAPGSAVVRGTNGPDVIVTRGVPEVRAADGADRICVTAAPGGSGGGPGSGGDATRTVYAGKGNDKVTVEPRATPYTWVVLGQGIDSFVGAGEPDDVWAGERRDPQRTVPADAVDVERDTISTAGGRDQVFVGQPAVLLRDVVDTGGSGDRVVVDATSGTRAGSLALGSGRDVLQWEWPDRVGGAWVFDALHGGARRDGHRQFTFSGVDDYRLPVPGRAAVRFTGTRADETVWAGSYARIYLAGGDDRFHVLPTYAVREAGSGVVDGGRGTDRLVVTVDRRFVVRLGDAMTFVDPHVTDARLTRIEDVDAVPGRGHARVVGDGRRNRLWTYGCGITLVGGAGDDRVLAVGVCGEEPGPKLRGGAGDDRIRGGEADDELRGGAGDDRLDGGPGRDTADGGTGDDRCVAEVRRRC